MRGPSDDGIASSARPEWIARPERSNIPAIRCIVWAALTLGRRATRILLYPICLYFLLSSRPARTASRKYLRKALAREPRRADLFRHYRTFAASVLDRVYLLNDQYARFDVRVHGQDIVDDIVARGEGCFLLGAHLGSFEMVRSLGRAAHGPRVTLVMYEENARKLNSVLGAINPELSLKVIALGKVDSMLKVEAALEGGDFVGMLGDRTIQGEGTVACRFFGEEARFPIGPFRLAGILNRPIVLMFGLYRGGNRYDIHFERLVDGRHASRAQRDLHLEQSMRCYVERLEHYCRIAPCNWFNFYDFWRAP
jgi:predicted LPLAT superfamily acyltransferase